MIPIVGVSLEEALLGFGGDDDAELHDKEVSLTTSDVTGSQTAVFEYDPENEPVTGTPPGPWDGYSLFTIDLSGVKDDIEDLQQQVSDLEDELEDCHDCRDAVVAAIQEYDPDYDPDPDECPAPEIANVYQAGADSVNLGSKFITANGKYLPASDNLDGYNQVVVDVPTWESCIQTIATKLGMQEPYDCQDIVEKLDEEIGVYVFPEGTPINPILELVGQDPVTDRTENVWIERTFDVEYRELPQYWYTTAEAWAYKTNGEKELLYSWGLGSTKGTECTLTIDDVTTGRYTVTLYDENGIVSQSTYTNRFLIGYGADGHTYSTKNKRG